MDEVFEAALIGGEEVRVGEAACGGRVREVIGPGGGDPGGLFGSLGVFPVLIKLDDETTNGNALTNI
jgi:hypothetical protein